MFGNVQCSYGSRGSQPFLSNDNASHPINSEWDLLTYYLKNSIPLLQISTQCTESRNAQELHIMLVGYTAGGDQWLLGLISENFVLCLCSTLFSFSFCLVTFVFWSLLIKVISSLTSFSLQSHIFITFNCYTSERQLAHIAFCLSNERTRHRILISMIGKPRRCYSGRRFYQLLNKRTHIFIMWNTTVCLCLLLGLEWKSNYSSCVWIIVNDIELE